MKPTTHILATLALAALAISTPRALAETSHLLTTQWNQTGPFAQFTPDNERVGCWSTAYAQILYYHRLKPAGRVSYECSPGRKIDVDLSRYQFDWAQFTDLVTAFTPKETTEQLARFSFATAVAVRKDFGTDHYKRVLSSVADLESHFAVDAEIYVHVGKNAPFTLEQLAARTRSEGISNVVDHAQIAAILMKELGEKRPVYFHFANLKNFGHSTVIDGFRVEGGRHMVHINFGDVALKRNRWYDLFAPLETSDDDNLRAFVTIKPLASR